VSSAPRVWMLTSVHPALDSRIFFREAKAASAAGYEVTVLAPDPPASRVDGIDVRRLPGPRGRLGRIVRWPILFAIALRARADIYQIHDPELLPWAVALRLLTRRAVVYDSHEFFSESILRKDWLPVRTRRPIAWLAERVEKNAARVLSAVVVVTPEMAERFRPYQREVVTVMNLPPSTAIRASDAPRDRAAIYVGLISRDRGLGILYETARTVRAELPDFELRVLGTIDWSGLEEQRRRSDDEWAAVGVRFLGNVRNPEVADRLAKAGVGWLPRTPGTALLAWPLKLGEYMVAGLPIVASDMPVQAKVIREADCGTIVAEYSGAAHGAAIAAFLADPQQAREYGQRGLAYASANLTWEAQARHLTDLYARLVRSVRPARGQR
jgi:glycosyltransferase involved in cell wall biosynthesis